MTIDLRSPRPPDVPAEAPAPAPRKTWAAKVPGVVGRSAKSVGTAAGLVVGLAGAAFVLVPNLKPATENVVRISDVAVEPDVSLRGYVEHPAVRGALARAGGKEQFLRTNCAALGRVGTVLHLAYEVKGFVDTTVAVRWSLVDGKTGRRLVESEGNDPLPLVFTARKRDGDLGSWELWVTGPPDVASMKVRVELYDTGDQARLTFKDSPVFPAPTRQDGPPGAC